MPLDKPVQGIIGACLTPFGEDNLVDYKALEHEIEFLVADCDAISIAAVEAAEYTMLTRDQRKELVRTGTEMVGKRVPVLAGFPVAFRRAPAIVLETNRPVVYLPDHGQSPV